MASAIASATRTARSLSRGSPRTTAPAGTEVAAAGRSIPRARALRRKAGVRISACPIARRSRFRPEAAASRRVADAAALPGIASAQRAGLRVVALDELRQRGVRAGEHNRSRRRRESRPGSRSSRVVGVELHMHPDVGVCSIGYDELIAVLLLRQQRGHAVQAAPGLWNGRQARVTPHCRSSAKREIHRRDAASPPEPIAKVAGDCFAL